MRLGAIFNIWAALALSSVPDYTADPFCIRSSSAMIETREAFASMATAFGYVARFPDDPFCIRSSKVALDAVQPAALRLAA